MLIHRGARLDLKNNFALFCATLNGHVEVVGALLDAGVDTNAVLNTEISWTAIDVAIDLDDDIVVLEYLIGRGSAKVPTDICANIPSSRKELLQVLHDHGFE